MRKAFIIIFLVLISACNNKKRLEIKDLKFSDIDQKGIVSNQIIESYKINEFESGFYQRKNDTIYKYKYNKNGNITYWRIRGFNSPTYKYKYDSLNLMTHEVFSSCTRNEIDYVYDFDSENLTLYKLFDNKYEQKKDTIIIYKFDKNGFIKESYGCSHYSAGYETKYITRYTYDSINLLKSKEIDLDISQKHMIDTGIKNQLINFFYTNKKIDSTYTVFTDFNDKPSHTQKTIYDEKGLKNKTIEIHNKFGALISHYKYKK